LGTSKKLVAVLAAFVILLGGACVLVTSDRYGIHSDPTGAAREIPLDTKVYAIAKDRDKYRKAEILLHTEEKFLQGSFGMNSGKYLEFVLKMCRFYSAAHEYEKLLVFARNGAFLSNQVHVQWDTAQLENFAAEAYLNLGKYPDAVAAANQAWAM